MFFRLLLIASPFLLAGQSSAHAIELSAGIERFSHYTPTVTNSTVPVSFLFVGNLSVTLGNHLVLGATGGKSIAGAQSREFGGTGEFIMGRKGRLEVRIYTAVVYYSTEPPTAPQAYQAQGVQARAGFNVLLRMGSALPNGPFLSLTLPVTRYSSTYNIAPAVGFGLRY